MRTLDHTHYEGSAHEELQVIMQRAHAQRAQAIREMFSALGAWLGRLGQRQHTTSQALPTATSR